ncbi:uncharacterized protein [Amphiura filiformis]|uniref:uncharacterized protein isoform X1 n=1 Tax=Amphiura filiformis TaxID=82378 RepID=UPI003B221286
MSDVEYDDEEARPAYMDTEVKPDPGHHAPSGVPVKPPSIGESTDEATRVLREREEKKRENESQMFVLSRESCKAQLALIDEEIAKLKERKEQRQRDREAFNDRLAEISERRKRREEENEAKKLELAEKRKENAEQRKADREREEEDRRTRQEEEDRQRAEEEEAEARERRRQEAEAAAAAAEEEQAQEEEEEEEE